MRKFTRFLVGISLFAACAGTGTLAYAMEPTPPCQAELDALARECAGRPRRECDRIFIGYYTGEMNRPLNAALRGYPTIIHPVTGATTLFDHSCAKAAARLVEALRIAKPVGKSLVFRGTGGLLPEEIEKQLQVGDCLSDPAFVSTSTEYSIARSFAGEALFQIESESGLDISPYSLNPSEQEVLFLPHTTFRYLGSNPAKQLREYRFVETPANRCARIVSLKSSSGTSAPK